MSDLFRKEGKHLGLFLFLLLSSVLEMRKVLGVLWPAGVKLGLKIPPEAFLLLLNRQTETNVFTERVVKTASGGGSGQEIVVIVP